MLIPYVIGGCGRECDLGLDLAEVLGELETSSED